MRACKHCPRRIDSTDDVARAAGWRWYSGPTVGGGHLNDVVCPVCAGVADPEALAIWEVTCETCDWSSVDDEGERITTAVDAVTTGQDHECEPVIRVKTPEGKFHNLGEFKNDGTLRSAVPA